MPDVRIVRGHIVPDAATVRSIAKAIEKEAKADPKVLESLKRNPRAFLGNRGLPIDSQRELMMEAGRRPKPKQPGGGCTVTCITTNCCVTCWVGSHL